MADRQLVGPLIPFLVFQAEKDREVIRKFLTERWTSRLDRTPQKALSPRTRSEWFGSSEEIPGREEIERIIRGEAPELSLFFDVPQLFFIWLLQDTELPGEAVNRWRRKDWKGALEALPGHEDEFGQALAAGVLRFFGERDYGGGSDQIDFAASLAEPELLDRHLGGFRLVSALGGALERGPRFAADLLSAADEGLYEMERLVHEARYRIAARMPVEIEPLAMLCAEVPEYLVRITTDPVIGGSADHVAELLSTLRGMIEQRSAEIMGLQRTVLKENEIDGDPFARVRGLLSVSGEVFPGLVALRDLPRVAAAHGVSLFRADRGVFQAWDRVDAALTALDPAWGIRLGPGHPPLAGQGSLHQKLARSAQGGSSMGEEDATLIEILDKALPVVLRNAVLSEVGGVFQGLRIAIDIAEKGEGHEDWTAILDTLGSELIRIAREVDRIGTEAGEAGVRAANEMLGQVREVVDIWREQDVLRRGEAKLATPPEVVVPGSGAFSFALRILDADGEALGGVPVRWWTTGPAKPMDASDVLMARRSISLQDGRVHIPLVPAGSDGEHGIVHVRIAGADTSEQIPYRVKE